MSPERATPQVVTISAPYGAGGSLVGPRLAERLGIPFLDRAIPAAVSTRLAVPLDNALAREEQPQGTLSRLISRFGPGVEMFAGATVAPEVLALDDDRFRAATEQVLHEFAATGGVILGRAGAVVLCNVPQALHVRLDGSRERRTMIAMRRRGIDRATAEHELRAADLSREAYVRHWYDVEPRDPSLYHLVIDSTAIDLEGCVELMALASKWRGLAVSGTDGPVPEQRDKGA
jgi:cytidylate kinase